MKLFHLVWREILHRKLNFFLAVGSVVIAVTCAVALVTFVHGNRVYTELRVAAMDNEIRKITKKLGFNIVILPRDENLGEFFANDFAAKTMPESHVMKLADSRDIITINHLRPALIRKIDWPEHDEKIILMGVRGVVPFTHRTAKKPLADPVPKGKINLGNHLARKLKLKPGDRVTLMGQEFELNKVYPPRGDKADITAWIDLPKAQEMLELKDQINMIQALECNCASIDRLAEIDAEVSQVLGDEVQVIELATKAIPRAQARTHVKNEGIKTQQQLQKTSAIVIPIVAITAALAVGLLSLANVHQRRQEIGILRALGMRSRQILVIFLTKLAIIGTLGAALGYAIGYAAPLALKQEIFGDLPLPPEQANLFLLPLLLAALIATPLLTVAAGWLPALSASMQDPTQTLQEP